MVRGQSNEVALEAIESVYRTHVDAFRGVAAAIVADRDRGCDVVQEAFARAIRRRRSFRGEGSLESWLWTTVVNTALSDRKRSLVKVGSESFQREVAAAIADPRPDGDLEDAIAALPERQRVTLFLRYYADLDYQTIAETLGIARGTVSATLNAAHGAVLKQLEEVAR